MPEPNLLVTLFILIVLELILGFDNILMVSIISQRVEEKKQRFVRYLGLVFAALNRIALVFFLSWFTSLGKILFYINNLDITVKDVVFFIGGSFLVWKSFKEIYIIIEYQKNEQYENYKTKNYSVFKAIFQIMALDSIFSIDSIITAIGLTENMIIIVFSILFSVLLMIFLVDKINNFILHNVSIKILALGFMFAIGVVLFLEVFDTKIPKIYLGMTLVFTLTIQLLQKRYKEKRKRNRKRAFIRSSFKKIS